MHPTSTTKPRTPELELEIELYRQCIEDGEALSDTLTMFAEMNGVGTVDDLDETEPQEM